MPSKPNLVFIFSDRQRRDTMSVYGNDWIKTPHLNELSDESIVFSNTYVTQAVCAPARASIMTGLYPHSAGMYRNKLVMPQDRKTIAEMVSADYRKAYFGKWHLGDEVVRQHGFEQWSSVMDRLTDEYTRPEYKQLDSDYHQFLLDNGQVPDLETIHGAIFSDAKRAALPAGLQITTFLAGKSEKFIADNKNSPFVLYASFLEPHPPFTGPYDGLYDPADLPVEPTFLKRPDTSTLFNRVRSDFFMGKGLTTEERSMRTDYLANPTYSGFELNDETSWRRLRAGYLSNITLVDDAVGRILTAIDNAGLKENTIVVFTSEHGDMVGTHGMLEMRNFYEEAATVPLLIRAPWLCRGQRKIDGNLGQIDLVPTLLDILGEPIPAYLQGTSRADILQGDGDLNADVFMEHSGIGDRDLGTPRINLLNTLPSRSVVTQDRWKLNLCAGDQGELYDLNADPYEEENLFCNPEHRDRIREMAARIRLWQIQTGDEVGLPSV